MNFHLVPITVASLYVMTPGSLTGALRCPGFSGVHGEWWVLAQDKLNGDWHIHGPGKTLLQLGHLWASSLELKGNPLQKE